MASFSAVYKSRLWINVSLSCTVYPSQRLSGKNQYSQQQRPAANITARASLHSQESEDIGNRRRAWHKEGLSQNVALFISDTILS